MFPFVVTGLKLLRHRVQDPHVKELTQQIWHSSTFDPRLRWGGGSKSINIKALLVDSADKIPESQKIFRLQSVALKMLNTILHIVVVKNVLGAAGGLSRVWALDQPFVHRDCFQT
jgi:hypothetical protein